MFTPQTCHVSHVLCHVSHVTCHVSHVTCHMPRVTCHVSHLFLFFFLTKWWSLLVEGLLSTGLTPSSFLTNKQFCHIFFLEIFVKAKKKLLSHNLVVKIFLVKSIYFVITKSLWNFLCLKKVFVTILFLSQKWIESKVLIKC